MAPGVTWIYSDFTTLEGVRHFLLQHRETLRSVTHFAHLYGPLAPRPTSDLTAEDFASAIHHNLLTAVEITRFLLAGKTLRSAVYCGTARSGTMPPLVRILPYAIAKNALLQTVRSWKKTWPHLHWSFFPLPGLFGGAFPDPGHGELPPAEVARRICLRLWQGGRGTMVRMTAAGSQG